MFGLKHRKVLDEDMSAMVEAILIKKLVKSELDRDISIEDALQIHRMNESAKLSKKRLYSFSYENDDKSPIVWMIM